MSEPHLRRSIGFVPLVLYGLGSIVGAGIYVLVGAVAGRAGFAAPFAFLLSALLVLPSALSFAELASRFPDSAGTARYLREGLRLEALVRLGSAMILLSAVLSSATLVLGFVGYFVTLIAWPEWLVAIGFVAILAAIAAWGIQESVIAAGIVSLLEVGTLVAIIAAGAILPAPMEIAASDFVPSLSFPVALAILAGAWLSFFAFIGFEDMVHIAEEVRDPSRAMPRAILACLAITTFLYVALIVVAVRTLPIAEFSESRAPLALVWERLTGLSGLPIAAVASFAVLNGVLIHIVMASRLLYARARDGKLPAFLARISPRTQTPAIATFIVAATIALVALSAPLVVLAEATSLILLILYALINLSLWTIQRREGRRRRWLAGLGFVASVGFAIAVLLETVLGLSL